MNVLMVYPGLIEGFGSYNRGSDWFNHGIGVISAVLKKQGYDIKYLDCRKNKSWDDVKESLMNIEFDVCLIYVATVDFDAAKKIAMIVKGKNSRIKIIVGGPHPTLLPMETSRVLEFDHVFTHEAELSLPKVLANLEKQPRIIRGEMPLNLDEVPFVDRSLAPDGETPWFAGLMRPYFALTASRGCLYNCSFCQPAEREIFGNAVRKRSVDNIIQELEILSRSYQMKSFMIHDDCFTQYPDWVSEFCRQKIEKKLTQPFVCQTRADIICKNPFIIEQLVNAGLQWVLIGFESGSDRVLKYLRKGTTVAQNIEAAKVCKKMGVKIFANYMFGLPTETNDEMRQTVEMMKLIQPEMHSPSVFTPAPGSDLYNYCVENDLVLIKSSSDYRRNANSGPKIRGVDYSVVTQMVNEAVSSNHKESIVLATHSTGIGVPLVSILLPTRDRWDYFRIAFQSAIGQTYPHIEVIVSDNSTNPETANLIAKFVAKYPQAKYFRTNGKLEAMDNFQNCIVNSTGEMLSFLMDDDIYALNKVEVMANIIAKNPNITLVTSYRQIIDSIGNAGDPIAATAKLFDKPTIINSLAMRRLVLQRLLNVIGEPTTTLFRKRDLPNERFGNFNNRQYFSLADLATWFSLMEGGDLCYLPEPYSFFRFHSDQDQHKLKTHLAGHNEWLYLVQDSFARKIITKEELHQVVALWARRAVDLLVPVQRNLGSNERCVQEFANNWATIAEVIRRA